MARIASFTSNGTPAPGGGMTLAALMARQKALADQQQAQASQSYAGEGTVAGGAGHALSMLFTGLAQNKAQEQETQGRQALAQLVAGVDPEKGATPQQIAQMGLYDPEQAQQAQAAVAQIIRERKAAEAAVANREDTQAFTHGENVAQTQAQADAAAAQQAATAGLQEDQQASTAEAAKLKRQQELMDPTTDSGKIMRDFQAGMYGDPTKPEAAARRDAELAKATALPGAGVTINTGDSGDLRKAFNKNIGEKVWPQYMQEAATAANLKSGMELLDALNPQSQGPLVGRLAEMFPGVDSQAAAFQSIVKRLAPQQRAVGSGSTSDIEYQGMLDSMPSLINHPEANRLISGMVKAQAQLSIERGNIVAKWQSGELDDAAAFQQINALNSRSIMSPQLKALIAQVQPGGGAGAAPGGADPEVDRLIEQYGQ